MVPLLLLALAATLLWCGLNHRLTPESWRMPVDYSGDSIEVLTRLQAAAEWGVVPAFHNHVARLGAPFGAEWSEYPAADDLLMLCFGQLSRLTGLGVASNLALLFAQVSAVWAFYICARYLRVRAEWAGAGALLFAFSFYNMSRGLAHLSLVITATVPLALLSCWLVGASGRLAWRNREGALCLGAAVFVGVGNPYNVFLYLQLMAWALVAQLVRRRRENIVAGVLCLGAAAGAFFLVNADVWLSVPDEGAAPLMARNYGGTEIYGLKPIELFLPPNVHRFAPLAFFGQRYLRWSDWRGEGFSAYLGVVGAVGLVWLLCALGWRVLRGRGRPLGAGLQAGWIFAFSSIGGVNSMLAFFFGLQIFRATNRYSIFLLALALLFLVARVSRHSFSWRRPLSFALAAALTIIGLLDQIPNRAGSAGAGAARWESDREFGTQLERGMAPGAMVFQLPIVEFPEARPIHRLADYELFRPYLHTRTLRFTYGSLKGHARGRWYRDYGALPPAELVARLEASGFAGIYVNRLGYPDRAEGLLAAFAAAGRTERIESRLRQQVFVRLHPEPNPRLPMATSLTFGQGWNPREDAGSDTLRWAYGPATMACFNPYDRPIAATVKLTVSGQGARHFSVALNRRMLIETVISADPCDLPLLTVELQPGVNRLDLATAEPAVRVSEARSRLRAFAVRDAEFFRAPADVRDNAR